MAGIVNNVNQEHSDGLLFVSSYIFVFFFLGRRGGGGWGFPLALFWVIKSKMTLRSSCSSTFPLFQGFKPKKKMMGD